MEVCVVCVRNSDKGFLGLLKNAHLLLEELQALDNDGLLICQPFRYVIALLLY